MILIFHFQKFVGIFGNRFSLIYESLEIREKKQQQQQPKCVYRELYKHSTRTKPHTILCKIYNKKNNTLV